MPDFKFSCQTCGSTCSEYFPIQDGPSPFPHDGCGMFQRVWTVPNLKRAMTAHWNPSVGQYISSEQEFNEALKRGSEEMSRKTGMDHNFVAVDPNDTKSLKVNEDNLEATHREHAKLGWIQSRTRIFDQGANP